MQQVIDRVRVGNVYVNRNQIGAVVGSQPFGGEGLSGTGPKAGGPHYLSALTCEESFGSAIVGEDVPIAGVQAAIDAAAKQVSHQVLDSHDLPGPVGESNRLNVLSRGVVLCLGPGDALEDQVEAARRAGCVGVPVEGRLKPGALEMLEGFGAVMLSAAPDDLRPYRIALARRSGPILPLIHRAGDDFALMLERHVCVDTTASGGNAQLLAL